MQTNATGLLFKETLSVLPLVLAIKRFAFFKYQNDKLRIFTENQKRIGSCFLYFILPYTLSAYSMGGIVTYVQRDILNQYSSMELCSVNTLWEQHIFFPVGKVGTSLFETVQ